MPYKSTLFKKYLLRVHPGLEMMVGAALVPPDAEPDGCTLPLLY